MRVNLTLLAALAGISLASCGKTYRGPLPSDVKSLDNFARQKGTDVEKHACSGSYQLPAGLPKLKKTINVEGNAAVAKALRAEVETALTAVPSNLQTVFFGLGGEILVSDKTPGWCSQNLTATAKKFASEGKGGPTAGCWELDAEQDKVVIHLDANTAAIRHSTVRLFGYVLSQLLTKLDYDDADLKLKVVDPDPEFISTAKDLTLALLSDVEANKKYDLSLYTSLLGPEVMKAKGEKRAKLITPTGQQLAFLDYAFAESFDSYYCSPVTRAKMTTDFPLSLKAFEKIADEIDALALAPAAKKASGLALADNGGEEIDTGYSLGIFGGLFRGIGRVGGGIIRGGGRVFSGIGRGLFGRRGSGGGGIFGGLGRAIFGRRNGGGGGLSDVGDMSSDCGG